MNFSLKLSLIVLNAFLIVSGQALMGILSRRLASPIEPLRSAREFLVHPAAYGFLLCYALSTIVYMALLRLYPLAEVTLSILVVMILMTGIYTYWLGHEMLPRQWIGVAVILAGVILLQGR